MHCREVIRSTINKFRTNRPLRGRVGGVILFWRMSSHTFSASSRGAPVPLSPPARGRDDESTLDPSLFLQLQEEERQRLAHALTSGPGQILANALMEVEYSLPLLEKNPKVALTGLRALRNELREGLAQLKDYVAELQPPLLDEMGLGPSVNLYCASFGERTGLRVECHGCETFTERYPVTIEIALFRILQEALMNVHTHAKATRVRVELARRTNQVQMTIQDNGRGFALRANAMPKKRQLGLIAMHDRAELLGGQLQLFSKTGEGVRVVVTIPYHGHPSSIATEGGQVSYEHNNSRRARAGTGKEKGKSEKRRAAKRVQNNAH